MDGFLKFEIENKWNVRDFCACFGILEVFGFFVCFGRFWSFLDFSVKMLSLLVEMRRLSVKMFVVDFL